MLLWLMNMGFAGGGQASPPIPPIPPVTPDVDGVRRPRYKPDNRPQLLREDEEILALIHTIAKWL